MSQSVPIFKTQAIEIKSRSAQEGRPIFEDREFVEIHIPGDNKSVVVHKVDQIHIDRWPEQYRAFKDGSEVPLEGSPVKEWPILTASRVAELHALKIKTIEQLAELKDASIDRIGMGGRELVKQAQAYLDVNKDTANAQKYAAENEKLHDEIDMLKAQIKEISDSITEQKEQKKGKAA
ncbi:MAG: hypothetical protein JKY88_09080 [Pseudomonadales bacterium]|nr:hypothetical protein [Pseudomonadales bacterium]